MKNAGFLLLLFLFMGPLDMTAQSYQMVIKVVMS